MRSRGYISGEDVTMKASMAKLKVGRLARELTDACLQYWGGMGFMWDNPVARAYRDSRLTSIGGGADEVMLGIICKQMNILPGRGNPPHETGAQFRDRYGPWALVAGASDGIGEAFARRLAQAGINVALVARRAAVLDALAQDLRAEYGIATREVVADLTADDMLATVRARPMTSRSACWYTTLAPRTGPRISSTARRRQRCR